MRIPQTVCQAMKAPAPAMFQASLMMELVEPVYTIPETQKKGPGDFISPGKKMTVRQEEGGGHETPEAGAHVDSHGVQRVVNLQHRHELREENVENSSDGSYEKTSPGLEAVTASTDGDHAWAGSVRADSV